MSEIVHCWMLWLTTKVGFNINELSELYIVYNFLMQKKSYEVENSNDNDEKKTMISRFKLSTVNIYPCEIHSKTEFPR